MPVQEWKAVQIEGFGWKVVSILAEQYAYDLVLAANLSREDAVLMASAPKLYEAVIRLERAAEVGTLDLVPALMMARKLITEVERSKK